MLRSDQLALQMQNLDFLIWRCRRLTIPILRDSRPSLKKDVTENKEINGWIEKYLGVGEWVMDTSVAFAGSSGFFERKR